MQNTPETSPNQVRVGFLLIEKFSNLCLSNALEPLRAANGFAAQPLYEWQFLTLDGHPVRSSSGLTVLPDAALADCGSLDRLYVISSYGHLDHDRRPLRRSLRQAMQRTGTMIGLDTGAWLMAGAGLLHGRRATIHWDLIEAFGERFLDTHVEQALWIADGDVITGAGAMATLDLSRHFIAEDLGPAIALDVEALFTAPPAPGAPDLPAASGDPLVTRAARLMRATLEQPLSLPDLARHLGTSPRTLSRRCLAAVNLSPGQLYRHIRLSAAREMVEGSRASVAEIALRCGYEDPTALTRAFRARFGQSPRDLRRRNAT